MVILVTRPSPAAEDLVSYLNKHGQVAWAFPLIEFSSGTQLKQLNEKLDNLEANDLVFILSKQGVYYANQILKTNDHLWPSHLKYYSVGRCTALELQKNCECKVMYPQDGETSETLLRLPTLQKINGKHALILCGTKGRNLLLDTLLFRGAHVECIQCYQSHEKYYNGIEESQRWRDLKVDTIVVTSGQILHRLYNIFPKIDRDEWLLNCKIIVISKRLANLAYAFGWRNIFIAESANNNVLFNTLKILT